MYRFLCSIFKTLSKVRKDRKVAEVECCTRSTDSQFSLKKIRLADINPRRNRDRVLRWKKIKVVTVLKVLKYVDMILNFFCMFDLRVMI